MPSETENMAEMYELGARVISCFTKENTGIRYRRHNYICDEAMFARIDSALLYKGDK